MYHGIKLTQPADQALSQIQNTQLSPMEEALFQAWSHANGIEKPDDPNNMVDLRGIYKGMNGMVLPQPQLKQIVEKANATSKLQQLLEERLKTRTQQSAQERLGNMDKGASTSPLGVDMPHPANNMGSNQGVS